MMLTTDEIAELRAVTEKAARFFWHVAERDIQFQPDALAYVNTVQPNVVLRLLADRAALVGLLGDAIGILHEGPVRNAAAVYGGEFVIEEGTRLLAASKAGQTNGGQQATEPQPATIAGSLAPAAPPHPETAAEGAAPQWHGQPCAFCGEPIDVYAGDPGLWPLGFPHHDGTGITRAHHARCVTERLFTLAPSPSPMLRAGAEMVQAAMDEWKKPTTNDSDFYATLRRVLNAALAASGSPGVDRPGGTADASTEAISGRGDGSLTEEPGRAPSAGRDPRQSSPSGNAELVKRARALAGLHIDYTGKAHDGWTNAVDLLCEMADALEAGAVALEAASRPAPSGQNAELVKRLREGARSTGQMEGEVELYDIDSAETAMAEAADAIGKAEARCVELSRQLKGAGAHIHALLDNPYIGTRHTKVQVAARAFLASLPGDRDGGNNA